ncbi:YecA family protein [Sporosarcina aquimarina]|uniref:SEC-C metal-binding domain-containing protein n=1 Tax=Sporosarcina aquimarina TaxID=114975 RepID=A0ABU4FZM6_9BACL|nr:SEC-C metal-binding domain-containing protein [Sporosarcina aquimarina]MDW0109555.1 SEC-C metal-binding domain-containing protein [Sporosarcina aquimarina]
MIGRNDPCPCGSGKKYKKCCAGKEQPTVEIVQAEELERILQSFYDEYPKQKDFGDYRQFATQWKLPLSSSYSEEMIEAIALDEFFFHERTDIWEDFVRKQLKKTVRPSVISVLEKWSTPQTLLGQVVEAESSYLTVYDRLNNRTVRLRRESEKPVPVDVHLWCFTLPDGAEDPDTLLAVSTLIFFPVDQSAVFDEFVTEFANVDKDSEEYMKNHAVDLWEKLAANGYEGEEFTDFEQGVLARVATFLEANDRESNQLLELIEDYLVEEQPNARKDVAIAAGAIRYGQEYNLFETLELTVKAIADEFEVSPSSLNRYYNGIIEYAKMKTNV